MRTTGLILLAGLLLSACDSGPKEAPPDLVKSQRGAMEKARQTETVIDQAATDRLKQADKEAK